jgi:hypothetical protein
MTRLPNTSIHIEPMIFKVSMIFAYLYARKGNTDIYFHLYDQLDKMRVFI